MKRRGFTLIELLVVIAIIAILAAILFPVFSRARKNAKQSACCSNMKQMATAMLMYAADHDEFVPTRTRYYGPLEPGMDANWRWPGDTVTPYLKNEEIKHCTVSMAGYAGASAKARFPWYAADYRMFGRGYVYSLAGCSKPAETVYWQESFCKVWAMHCTVLHPFVKDANHPDPNGRILLRGSWWPAHGMGQNFSYVDGHAKWLRLDDYRAYKTWQLDIRRWVR